MSSDIKVTMTGNGACDRFVLGRENLTEESEFQFQGDGDRVKVTDLRRGGVARDHVDLVLDVDGESISFRGYTFTAQSETLPEETEVTEWLTESFLGGFQTDY